MKIQYCSDLHLEFPENRKFLRRNPLKVVGVKNLHDGVVLDIASLSERFDTTDRTIRRDLEILERFGWIKSAGATRNAQYSLMAEGLKKLNDSD